MSLKRSQGTVGGLGSERIGVVKISDLSDVDTTGVSANDHLVYELGGETAATADSATANHTSGSYVAANTIDGSTGTYWHSGYRADQTNIYYDFIGEQELWSITTDHASSGADHPNTMEVHGSANATDWNFVRTCSGVTNAIQEWTFTSETWRYWRLSGTAGVNWWKLYETYFAEPTGSNWVPVAHNVFDQSVTDAAVPVIELTQDDVDEDYFKFTGTSDTSVDRALVDAANFTTPGSIVGWLKIIVVDEQGTNPITDGDYYIPFYSAPSA